MATYTFLQSIFTVVDAAVDAYISSTVTLVAGEVGPIVNQCFLLYMFLWGFAMYRGMIDEPILDGTFRIMKLLFITHLAVNVGTYNGLVADNIIALPDYLTSVVGDGGTSGSSRAVLDNILSDTIETGNKLWDEGSILTNVGALFMAIIVWLSAILCTGYAAFLLILSKVALGVLVALGPVFIFLAIFDSTKRFFDAWIGQCINYALISAMAISVVKLLFGMYAGVASGSAAAAASSSFSFASVASLFLLSVICMLVLMQVQSIASSLAGGVALSTLGAINWAGRNFGRAGAIRPSNIQKTFRNIQKDYRATADAAKTAATPLVWAQRKLRGGNSVSAGKSSKEAA